MELGFDFRTVGKGEAEAAENLNRAVFDDSERVK